MPAKLTTEEFIDRARAIHGDKYGYAFSVYQHSHTKVMIHCLKHGMFEQIPYDHLRGQGCPDCSRNKKYTNESFIEKAIEVHGENTYYYPLVRYINVMTKVKIICPEHGDFEQIPYDHLRGQGCPGCSKHGFDRTKVGFLYVLRSECGQYMKIGITNKPEQRYDQLSRTTPFPFKRIELIEGQGNWIFNLEKKLLATYQLANFTENFNGYSEWRLWDKSVLIHFQN